MLLHAGARLTIVFERPQCPGLAGRICLPCTGTVDMPMQTCRGFRQEQGKAEGKMGTWEQCKYCLSTTPELYRRRTPGTLRVRGAVGVIGLR